MKLFSTKTRRARRFLASVVVAAAFSGSMMAQLSGTKNIPGDYATMALAITDLNTQGVGPGGVTLNMMAGNPETAPAGGYVITASGSAANPISITGNANTITASGAQVAGTLTDAIFKITGGDYITITGFTMQENAANTTTATATNNMTEWGVAVLYNTTTDGAQNVTILNNTISLNRTYPNTFGIYSNSAHSSTAIAAASATGATGGNNNLHIYGNTISNVNMGIVAVGPTAAADFSSGLDIGGSSFTQGNTISNYGTTGTFSAYASVAAAVNGILAANTLNYNISYNTIASSNGGVTAGTVFGIYVSSFAATPTGAQSNTIGHNNVSVKSGLIAGAIFGIAVDGATSSNTSTLTISSNDFNNFGHTVAGTGAITFINNLEATSSININGNTFTNMSVNTTGNVRFISNDIAMPSATSVETMNYNSIVTGFTKTGAGGTVQFLYISASPSSPTGSMHTATGNSISNITVSGATTLIGWSNLEGAPGPTKLINGNTFSNWTGGTSAVTVIATNWSGNNSSISNNMISGITSSGAITGISLSASNGGTLQTVASNTITSLSGTGTVLGITGGSSGIATLNVNNNAIYTFSTTGATVAGISMSAGTTLNIFKNKVYDITSSNTSPTASGILVSGGTTGNVYNNTIGDIKAPLASAANAVIGINLTGGTTDNIYYNTVYLSASSSGTNFGSSAIYATSGPGTFNFRNNIFFNNSTPSGTGVSAAFRKNNSTLTAYGSTSNNNLLYAGTPSATRVLFYDGTTGQQTLANFKTLVGPTRDAGSVTENLTFASTTGSAANFLHINNGTSTAAEGGAVNIAGYTDDFDGDIRQGNAGYAGTGTTPDIGADEFEGTTPAPVINSVAITPTGTQCTAVSRNVTATITPGSSALTSVVLNYAVNGATQTPIPMTGGNVSASSTWSATIPVASPANAIVTWTVVVTDGTFTKSAAGPSYSDAPLLGVSLVATVAPNPICAGNSATLTAVANTTTFPTYALPTAVTNPTTDEDLGNVTFGALNNTTVRNSLVGTIGTAAATSTAGSYSDFTAFGPYDFKAGTTYTISLSTLQNTTPYGNAVGVYIDYNRNGSFTDAGEAVYVSSTTTSGAHTETASITIPATAQNGLTRMRIVVNEGAVTGPNMTVAYGEFEEYMLRITNLPTFSWSDGTTTVGTSNPLTVTPSVNTTYSVTATDANGCSLASAPVTLTVTPLPTAPTVTNSSQCGVGVPAAQVGGGTSYNWYATPTSTTVLQSGSSNTYTTSISATTTFYVASVSGACLSTRSAVTTTVSIPDGVAASTSAANICPAGSATLTATQLGTTNPYVFSWTASPAAGSGIPTSVSGATTVVMPTVAGTYVYVVTATDGICTTTSSVSVTLNTPPVINASASPTVICSGASVNLNATTSTIASGTVAIGTSTNVTGATSQPTAFCNRWTSYRQQSVFTAAELTAAGLSAGNITSIAYNITTLGDGATNPNFTVKCGTTTVSTFTDFIASTGFTTVFPPATYTHSVGINTITFSTPFNWDGVSNVAVEVSHDGADLTNNSQTYYTTTAGNTLVYAYAGGTVGTPTNQRLNVIFGGQAQTQSSGGLTWQWNPGAINSNTTTVNPVNTGTVAATQVYTITGTNTLTTCSNTATVGILVNPLPATPVAHNSTQCGLGVPTASVSGGTSYKWYAAATSTAVLQSGTSATYTTAINSTTTFYVSSFNGTCESPRVALTETVTIPDAVTAAASPTSVCAGGSTTLTVTQTGSTNIYGFTWTASPAAGSGIPTSVTGSSVVVTPTAAGTYAYLVTASDGVCTTTSSVSVVLNNLPTITATASPTMVCSGSAVNLNAVNATITTGTVAVGTSTNVTGATTQPTAFCNRWASYRQQSVFTAAELTAAGLSAGNINSITYNITTLGDAATNANFTVKCGTTTVSAFTDFIASTGFTTVFPSATYTHSVGLNTIVFSTPYNWDGVSNLAVEVSHDGIDNINNSQTYYTTTPGNTIVYSYNGGAVGTPSTQRLNVIFNGQKVTFGSGGITWQWNPGAINSSTTTVNPVNTGTTAITQVYTITATSTITTCSNTATVGVVVNPIPTAPVAHNAAQCGFGVPTASVSGGTSYNWYATPTSTTALQTGTSATYTTAINSTTTFYVASFNGNCESSTRTAVTETVTIPDAVTASATATAICPGGSTTLIATQSGTTNPYVFTWTASPAAGSGIPTSVTGKTVTIMPGTPGSYIYTVTAADGVCTTLASVSITVNPAPNISNVTATPSVICSGSTVTLSAVSINGAAGTSTVGTQFTTDITGGPFRSGAGSDNRAQYLFTAAELNAAGIQAGNITALSFSVTSLGTGTMNNWTLKIGSTATTSLTTTFDASPLATVYGPVGYTATAGLNTFTFATPFNWNGTSNVIVQVCHDATLSGSSSVAMSNTPNTAMYTLVTGACTQTSGTSNGTERPVIVFNGIVGTNVSSSINFVWNPGAIASNTAIVTPTNPGTTPATQMYTITATDPVTTCTNSAVASVTVNPLPSAPVVFNSLQCGVAVPTASVSGGTSYNWYNAATSGTLIQSGASQTYTGSISSTTTFYVSSFNGTCESPRAAVTASVTSPDAITASVSSASICPNTAATLSVTQTGSTNTYNYTWTAAPVAGSGIPTSVTGATVSITPTLPGVYVYTVTGIDAACTAVSSTTLTVFNAITTTPSVSAMPNPLCTGSSATLTGIFAGGTAPTYSLPPAVSNPTTDEDLGNVTFGPLNNTTAINSLVGTIGTASGVAGSYSDFTAFGPYPVTAGSIYPLSVDVLQQTTAYNNSIGVYIDFNKNGVFTDPGEDVYVSSSVTPGAHTETSNIAIPASAASGLTRMRVLVNESGTPVSSPNTAVSWGEYEEYMLNILPNVAYTWTDGTMTAGTTNTVVVTPTVNTTYSFSVTDGNGCSINSAALTVSVAPIPTVTAVSNATAICAGSTAILTASGATSYTWTPGNQTLASIVVAPNVSTTYTLTGANSAGCTSTATVALVAIPLPTVTAAASNTVICAGNTVTLTAGGATNYTWTPSGATTMTTVVSPTVTTNYTVSGSNGTCAGTAVVHITVNNVPTLSVTPASTTICAGSTATLTGSGATTYSWSTGSTTTTAVVTPTSSATYTLTGSNSCGTSTITATVSTVTTPTVTAVASSSVLCAGSSATITASGATSYSWTPGGATTSTISVTPTANTTYTVRGTNACGTASAVTTVTLSPTPTVTAVSSRTSICAQDFAVLTASGASSYTWSPGGATTSSITVTPTVTTAYVVTGRTAAGCTATATVNQLVLPCTGVDEATAGAGIELYPNPNIGSVNVNIPSELVGRSTIQVYDAIGKLVIKENLTDASTHLNTSRLEEGLYIYKIFDNNGVAVKIGRMVRNK